MTRSARAVSCAIVLSLVAPFAAMGQAPSVATTSSAIASASSDYLVGPGDLLTITVYRSPDLAASVRVASDGTIPVASLGNVKAEGLTASEIAAEIARELKARGILVDPSVNVLVADIQSKKVLVMGSVARPGEVPLDRPGLTLAAVLARSGATFGSGSGIVTIMANQRQEGPREQFRMADLVSGARDREARPGEILVVQAAPMVYVSGEVGKPGSYSLEQGMTVGQALALGGGVTPRGSANRIRLTRKHPDGTTETLKHVKSTTLVEPDDLIFVRARVF